MLVRLDLGLEYHTLNEETYSWMVPKGKER